MSQVLSEWYSEPLAWEIYLLLTQAPGIQWRECLYLQAPEKNVPNTSKTLASPMYPNRENSFSKDDQHVFGL